MHMWLALLDESLVYSKCMEWMETSFDKSKSHMSLHSELLDSISIPPVAMCICWRDDCRLYRRLEHARSRLTSPVVRCRRDREIVIELRVEVSSWWAGPRPIWHGDILTQVTAEVQTDPAQAERRTSLLRFTMATKLSRGPILADFAYDDSTVISVL